MFVSIIVTVILLGVVLYLVELIPMDPTFMRIVRVLAIVAAIWYVLSAIGVLPALSRA
jgi:hypothetical protein